MFIILHSLQKYFELLNASKAYSHSVLGIQAIPISQANAHQDGALESSKSAMNTLAPEFRALMTILRSGGPVISTRLSSRSCGSFPTWQAETCMSLDAVTWGPRVIKATHLQMAYLCLEYHPSSVK